MLADGISHLPEAQNEEARPVEEKDITNISWARRSPRSELSWNRRLSGAKSAWRTGTRPIVCTQETSATWSLCQIRTRLDDRISRETNLAGVNLDSRPGHVGHRTNP